ncbi:DUF2971 domain-containing protein [Bradyrhizobium sp. 35]|uniref:DUF2971 domain-containing protein n=1 Tax=Bradyrhizobium sp. 35 TaxID=2782670 RepID=UPI001FF94D58|nr:DUF2971 domain-containing protein [Bradyrhizobium sp. 35]MCK1455197.1 DUF2971 domain-containing protein [Bradyrhizobium sp. 35]
MKADNIFDIPDLDAPIYHIYSKHWFLDLLKTGENGLVKPRIWDDPFENFFLRSEVTGPAGEKISIENLAEDWYGQCWTLNADTDAMWRIYSPDKDGIKVRTTVRKLFDSFYDARDTFADLKYLIGKVQYKTEAEIAALMGRTTFANIAFGGQATGFARLLSIKREAFIHENEVRLLFQDLDPKRASGVAARFGFDVNKVCDEVVLDPRLDQAGFDALESEIKSAGCAIPISQSTLYRAPKFNLALE